MTTADQILKNTGATLEITFTAGDASGNVTYTVTDAAGASVATGTATNETEAGRYTFVLAPQAAVKDLTVVWAGSWAGVAQSLTTYASVVGEHLFTVADARAYDNAVFANTTTYPSATIRETRAGITDFFEQVTDVSFIPRYGREVLDTPPGGGDLWLSRRQIRSLLAASVGGTALSAPELADVEAYEYGRLYNPSGWVGGSVLRQNIVIEYEHGYSAPPFDIHQAALMYLRYLLVPSDISDRIVSYTNDLGTFRNALPGQKYPTGIPSVDAALGRYTAGMVLA